MQRRSRSTSRITIRQPSRSTARSRTPAPSTSAVNSLASTDRLTVPKRSNSVGSRDNRGFFGGQSSTAKARSSDDVRPGSSASGTHSPTPTSELKSIRKVNIDDKKWVQEQYAKVRRFLQEHVNFQERRLPDLKPPTINTFVRVTDLLIKFIDPSMTIDSSNYKEKIPLILKKFQYPLQVTNSLLKTVNTMPVWPHVVSIWAWLVDLSRFINRNGLPNNPKSYDQQCIIQYFCKRYDPYSRDEDHAELDEEFRRKFAHVLKVAPNEAARLQREVDG